MHLLAYTKILKISTTQFIMQNTITSNINYMQAGDFFINPNTCRTCHKPYFDMGESSVPVQTCQCYQTYNTPILMGWKCPCCGGGVAPGVERCPCTPIKTYYTTTTTGPYIQGSPTFKESKTKNKS